MASYLLRRADPGSDVHLFRSHAFTVSNGAAAELPEVRPEPADLAGFVEEFLRTSPQIAEAADVELQQAARETPVAIDRALMRRVLANLLRNAEEAARPARARIHIAIAHEQEQAALVIADVGPGIAPEVRSRIFDPYFTTKSDGTGLGLAIVKKIVLQHGGDIEVGERAGGGAEFRILLPLAKEAPQTPAMESGAA